MQNANPRKDFILGFFGFFGFNLALLLIFWAIGAAIGALPRSISQSGALNSATIFLFCCFPGLANMGAEIYLYIKQRWMALGALIGLGAGIVLASIGMAMLIASGFSLV
jgi:hypothetical protein